MRQIAVAKTQTGTEVVLSRERDELNPFSGELLECCPVGRDTHFKPLSLYPALLGEQGKPRTRG